MDPTSEPQLIDDDDDDTMATHSILITHSGKSHTFTLPTHSTLSDLRLQIQQTFSISPEYQKLTAPKLGLLKDDSLPITTLPQPPKKILLIGSSNAAIQDIKLANSPSASTLRKFGGTGPIKPAKPVHRRVDFTTSSNESKYTFGPIRVLTHLPNPQRSETYLRKLAADPGIKAVMIKHKFSVGMLSEMDPAEHTTHESRTLGLNRNAGEEILLRLRTDRDFWELYKVILKGVEEADWRHGGRTLEGGGDGGRILWEGEERERLLVEEADGGGWIGGSFVLGGGGGQSGNAVDAEDRRSMAARAAEERAKKMKDSSSGTA
ncbi:hypothetical protein TWF225_004868 [Orbilia oligospora]|nr:hypothetical protein TWF751_000941 [Orbilia oligospora]KAF3186359.1 hypothetical protein TWF225_004868 [Orbilia oligospora]KAF3272625.1 hypothetical protein TWF217_000108 [Orbilia oligospora]